MTTARILASEAVLTSLAMSQAFESEWHRLAARTFKILSRACPESTSSCAWQLLFLLTRARARMRAWLQVPSMSGPRSLWYELFINARWHSYYVFGRWSFAILMLTVKRDPSSLQKHQKSRPARWLTMQLQYVTASCILRHLLTVIIRTILAHALCFRDWTFLTEVRV